MKRIIIFLIASLLGGIILFISCQNPAMTSAKVYMKQKNYDSAIEQCKLALETNPGDAGAYFVMGQAYAAKKMYREMAQSFAKSLENGPVHEAEITNERNRHWTTLLNAGVALYGNEKISEASENFLLCTEIDKTKTMAHIYLASTYEMTKQNDKAEATYKKVIEIEADNITAHFQLGILYYNMKKYQEAIDILGIVTNLADKTSKEYSNAVYHIAISYDLMGQEEKAVEAYEKVLADDPDDIDMIFNLGRLYLKKENYESALNQFQKVIEIKTEDFHATHSIGLCYLYMENWNDAILYFKKAVSLNPDEYVAWNNLYISYARANMPREAEEAFEKAESLKENQ